MTESCATCRYWRPDLLPARLKTIAERMQIRAGRCVTEQYAPVQILLEPLTAVVVTSADFHCARYAKADTVH